jgi:hypothetical protein
MKTLLLVIVLAGVLLIALGVAGGGLSFVGPEDGQYRSEWTFGDLLGIANRVEKVHQHVTR